MERKRILVVEDDDTTRELVRMTLERHGYKVVEAENGIEGFDTLVREPVDLVITDINMPAADGAHLVRRVRGTPEMAHTPILIVTGYGTGSASLTLAQGADAFEPKPIDPHRLIASVRRILNEGGAAATRSALVE
jgi:CheY-like chemotaxis protein